MSQKTNKNSAVQSKSTRTQARSTKIDEGPLIEGSTAAVPEVTQHAGTSLAAQHVTTDSPRATLAESVAALNIEDGLSDHEARLLAATPDKARAFLHATTTKLEIRKLLFAAGYSEQEQARGWSLLRKVTDLAGHLKAKSSDNAVRKAVAAIDAWDEPGFRRVSAALERLHPEQHAFVFAGLQPTQGPGAVLGVVTLLDRLDQLEAGTRPGASAADKAVFATLAARQFGPEQRAHLRSLVSIAQSVAQPSDDPMFAQYQDALRELRAWHKDWASTARAVVTRKDYRIMLGLSKRRRSEAEETAPEGIAATQPSGVTAQPTAPVPPSVVTSAEPVSTRSNGVAAH